MPLLPQRLIFPEPSPSLCVTFFTCGTSNNVSNTADLQHTYSAAVAYFEAERAIRYEFVWLDNGGSKKEHSAFIKRGAQFEKHLRNPSNEGVFRAVNDVWFRGRGCRAPYVLSLEDDRVPRPDILAAGAARTPHLTLAIELLKHDATIAGVRLKDEWSDEVVGKAAVLELEPPPPSAPPPASPSEEKPARTHLPMRKTPSGSIRYAPQCMAFSSGFVWGSFSLAAVVYDRLRLNETVGMLMEGPPHDVIPYDYLEGQYAVRVGLANLCTARPHFVDACSTLDHDNTPMDQSVDSTDRDGPCHQVFIETRQPRERSLDEFDWFFYGTSMQKEAEQSKEPKQQEAPKASPPPSQQPDAEGCDGSRLSPKAQSLFKQLDAGTRAGSKSGDYSAAASAFAQLSKLLGGRSKVVGAFECAGVSAFYAQHLEQWSREHPPKLPPKPKPFEKSPPPPTEPAKPPPTALKVNALGVPSL